MMPTISSYDLLQKAFVFLWNSRYNGRVEFFPEHKDD
jgi:hypothetical protein